MPKEFKIPPISFPTTTPSTTTLAPRHHRHHHHPIPPFRPFHTSSLPFITFETTTAASLNPSSFPSAVSTTTFDNEPPLLEELEIDPVLIYHKTLSLLNPITISPHLHINSPDLSGPFLYYLTFSLLQLIAGKFQFGIILGWVLISSTFLYVILNFLAGRDGNLDLYRCVSVVGYCLLPIVIFSAVSLFLPPPGGSVYGFGIAAVFVGWATRLCSKLLAVDSLGRSEHFGLIAYPCFLIYSLFSVLVMF